MLNPFHDVEVRKLALGFKLRLSNYSTSAVLMEIWGDCEQLSAAPRAARRSASEPRSAVSTRPPSQHKRNNRNECKRNLKNLLHLTRDGDKPGSFDGKKYAAHLRKPRGKHIGILSLSV